jgi:plastocyanin
MSGRHVLPAVFALLGLLSLTITASPMVDAQSATAKTDHHYSMQNVQIDGGDYYFKMPTTFRAGLSRFTFTNTGHEAHQAQFFKFKPGYGEADLLKALGDFLNGQTSFQTIFNMTSLMGGLGSIEAGKSQTYYENLTPGRYEIVCFDATATGELHFLMGMYKAFTVTPGYTVSWPPRIDGTVQMHNLTFSLPRALSWRAPITLKVHNAGPGKYEFDIFKLNAGVTFDQYVTCINTAGCVPPVTDMGGIPGLEPGGTAYIDLHLGRGNYAVASFVPDPATGYFDANEGMVASFTVR